MGQAGARDYFEHFLAKDPIGKVVEEEIIEINSESYLHAGMYNFELTDKDQRSTVQARFSYLWKKEDKEWKIFHHHSSLRPK